MNSLKFISRVKKKEIDVAENTAKVIEKIKKINKEYNYFNVISEELALELAKKVNIKGKLAGLPVSIKDNICVKGVESTAGSRILEDYKPSFNATAVQKVIKEGGIIIGKTSQDAFGFGSFSVNVGLGMKIPLNPFDKERSCGGSSGGSGGITQKADFAHISLGESTGGSIECPASFCGVIGFCPTYGRVSRYGLIDYANSFDKIGPMAKSFDEIALMLSVISGYDSNDSTSIDARHEDYTKYIGKKSNLKIGIIKDYFGDGVDSSIVKAIMDKVPEYDYVELPIANKYSLPTYYLLALSEASTNLAKYCGMRYGASGELKGGFNEYFSSVRSSNLNEETKRRILLGTFARMSGYRDAYYLKAAKVRTLIINEYKKLFKKYDILISPVTPYAAPKFSEISKMSPLQNYMADIMTVGPNIAGIPHASVPVGFKGNLPMGMMIMADHLQEGKLIQFGSLLK